MGWGFARRMIGAMALAAVLAVPAAAQFSDGYYFLKAVRDRDWNKANELLGEPGSTIITSRDQTTDETALHIVVRGRDLGWTSRLLSRGASPDVFDKNKVTPLALAVNLGFIEGAELLLKRRARVDPVNAAGETPLIAAVHKRDLAAVRLLMQHGANPDRPDNSGRSARDYAKLMGTPAGVIGEIERAEAARKGTADKDAYGPSL